MSNALLDIRQLDIAFPPQPPVVRGLDLRIQAGQSLALVGESGSGKSLTSLAVMGLLPTSAQVKPEAVWFNGQNVHRLTRSGWQDFRGKQAAMVFQEPMTSLNPVMRCGKQVAEHLSGTTAEKRAQVLALFKEVELPHPERIFKAYPHALSGGQKQRVMLAMAVAANPALLIADEPTTALDVTVQKRVLQLIRRMQTNRNMAVLFITHDLAVVREVADHIAVLFRGDLVESGPAAHVLERPEHAYTRALIACRPPTTGKPFPLPTVSSVMAGHKGSQDTLPPFVPSGAPVLEIHGLRKTYGKGEAAVKALDGVDLHVHAGEVLGLVGESGCGKSTVSKCISGLVHPDAGTLTWKGQPIDLRKLRARQAFSKEVQMVFQDPFSSLTPNQTVGQALTEVLHIHSPGLSKTERQARIADMLDEVGLPQEAADRYPHSFSGGQRQRVVVARALLTDPELIICDESVSALDVSVQAQILNLLNTLKMQRNLAFLFISHDLNVVRYMSDRIAVMRRGLVVETGDAGQVCSHPQHAYTKSLMDAIPKG